MPFTKPSSLPTPTSAQKSEGLVSCESKDNLAFLNESEPPIELAIEDDDTMILEVMHMDVIDPYLVLSA